MYNLNFLFLSDIYNIYFFILIQFRDRFEVKKEESWWHYREKVSRTCSKKSCHLSIHLERERSLIGVDRLILIFLTVPFITLDANATNRQTRLNAVSYDRVSALDCEGRECDSMIHVFKRYIYLYHWSQAVKFTVW